MHILQVGTFPYPSPQGSQVYVKGIMRSLVAAGNQVTLLCYGHGVGEVTVEQQEGIQIIRTPKIVGYQNMRAGPDWVKPWLDIVMALKLRRLQPDIIHVHNYEAPVVTILAKLLGRNLRGIPMVYSAHNIMGEELPTYFSSPMMKRITKHLGRLMDVTIPQMANHVIVLRKPSLESLRKLGCQQVSVVRPSVDPTKFKPVEELRQHCPLPLQNGQWVVYAGNPDAYQNLDILIEAMNHLPNIGLVMVSASDTSHWQREQGRILHVQTRSFFEVQHYIANADLAVVPRMQCTGFPIKILNYLMLECVTLVSEGSWVDLPGVISFPNGDVARLVQKITACLHDDVGLMSLKKKAREAILEHCTPASQSKQLVEIYLSLLKT